MVYGTFEGFLLKLKRNKYDEIPWYDCLPLGNKTNFTLLNSIYGRELYRKKQTQADKTKLFEISLGGFVIPVKNLKVNSNIRAYLATIFKGPNFQDNNSPSCLPACMWYW